VVTAKLKQNVISHTINYEVIKSETNQIVEAHSIGDSSSYIPSHSNDEIHLRMLSDTFSLILNNTGFPFKPAALHASLMDIRLSGLPERTSNN